MTKKEEEIQNQSDETQAISARYIEAIEKEYSGVINEPFKLNKHQRKLAYNMMLLLQNSLNEYEAKRIEKNQTNKSAYIWANVDMPRVARDSIHRIMLGLDAMIPNHISCIPYWDSAKGKYKLDMQVGYVGKDYYRRQMAIDAPKDIIYELVHENERDDFIIHKRDLNNDVESYSFNISNPWDRGEIIGGFGYLMFDDSTKNKLVIVTEADFQKYESCAKSPAFWTKWPVEMRYKSLVHRTTEKLMMDPKKVNASYHYVEEQERANAYGEDLDDERLNDISSQPKVVKSLDAPKQEIGQKDFDNQHKQEPATSERELDIFNEIEQKAIND